MSCGRDKDEDEPAIPVNGLWQEWKNYLDGYYYMILQYNMYYMVTTWMYNYIYIDITWIQKITWMKMNRRSLY